MTNPKRQASSRGDVAERKRREKALDDALMNTFPASDPVSIEQPAPRHNPHKGEAERDEG